MKKKLKLSTFQIGNPARRGEGLRVGVTRRPPRGIPKTRWESGGYFDVWFPALAPSAKLLAQVKNYDFENAVERNKFFDSYERELMASAEGRQTIDFFAQIAVRIPISIGCFCEDESRCHRSRLFNIIQEHAPSV
jgi:uncharacterized protein YeaO (DUF488 family)